VRLRREAANGFGPVFHHTFESKQTATLLLQMFRPSEGMAMDDSANSDDRLIAATLASGLLANASKETTTRAQGTPAQAAVAIYFECLGALRAAREKRAK
jgi:hypothetical protein